MFPDGALLAWSALGLAWWVVSLVLVSASGRPGKTDSPSGIAGKSLTIFKPLPPLSPGEEVNLDGIASFLAQLGPRDELLLGVHEPDRAQVAPKVAALGARFPQADLRVVWRSGPDAVPNPKIAWLRFLAPHGRGELWLWSDADIVAPAGFLRSALEDYAAGGARLVTWPYVVRAPAAPPALLDALYVNAEFFPGVLLLRRLGPVDFGLGAALLFAPDDFEAAVTWEGLGLALADDFQLGRALRPVCLGRAVLATSAEARTWRDALLHYLRWNKTVRWNRPGGTAARIIIMPVLGWLAEAVCRPLDLFGWVGLVAMMQVDVVAAVLIFRRLGCPLRWRNAAALELWSLGRALVWLACWLPWPVVWRGQRWSGPFAQPPSRKPGPFDKA